MLVLYLFTGAFVELVLKSKRSIKRRVMNKIYLALYRFGEFLIDIGLAIVDRYEDHLTVDQAYRTWWEPYEGEKDSEFLI
jgi:hypothetical protein